jgi:hypothetical protein
MHGLAPCLSFGALRPDAALAGQVLDAVRPLAVEAAAMAEEAVRAGMSERRRSLELERQQAEYDVRLAARRYEAVDPDQRLVAAELEACTAPDFVDTELMVTGRWAWRSPPGRLTSLTPRVLGAARAPAPASDGRAVHRAMPGCTGP